MWTLGGGHRVTAMTAACWVSGQDFTKALVNAGHPKTLPM
jgi:endonuclease YncB( thermonuclease family)